MSAAPGRSQASSHRSPQGEGTPVSTQLPPLLQDSGVPFDLFIQALTEQLDKAQAGMAIKARLGQMPLTFAVKEVSLDLIPPPLISCDHIFIIMYVAATGLDVTQIYNKMSGTHFVNMIQL
jgi:hypothetical protein